jgi:hypothetical protein
VAGTLSTAFLYQWTDKSNGMLYVGSHKGRPDDGYICSSKVMLSEYQSRTHDFERKILLIGDDSYVRNMESSYLVAVNAAKNPIYYNKHNSDGKFIFKGGKPFTEKHKRNLSLSLKGKNKGKVWTDEQRQAMSIRRSGELHPMYGLQRTQETKDKISKANKGKIGANLGKKFSAETCKKISEASKGNKKWLGRKHSDESKRKMAAAKTGVKRTEESNAKHSLSVSGENNHFYGKQHSEETKRKISIARKLMFAARLNNDNHP